MPRARPWSRVAEPPTARGRGLRAGRLILLGDTGDALGWARQGGVILAAAGAGHRAGLGQRGGVLVVLGPLGRLAGERQSRRPACSSPADQLGPHAGHGRRGGELLPDFEAALDRGLPAADAAIFRRSLARRPRRWVSRIVPRGAVTPDRSSRQAPALTDRKDLVATCTRLGHTGQPAGGAAGRGGRMPRGAGAGPIPDDARRAVEVVEAGRPVAGGWIEFVPVDGTVGDRRSAPLAADGRFEVSGVAVGRNVIGLVNAPIRCPAAGSCSDSRGSPIRRDIPAGPRPR